MADNTDNATEAEEYLASLDDDAFTKLLARVRPPGSKSGPGSLQAGRELYRNNGRRTIEVDRAPEHIAWESK
ncbi:hypothetical protein [Mycolicibacterium neoaurum]|uniref:hypothetical protein n=1 Tax=Mycolicibacterium neoaurum TaxID=1795 RepID=UPI001F4C926D|nr:hypothetical protein [Mycolicibacterium neoaurum]